MGGCSSKDGVSETTKKAEEPKAEAAAGEAPAAEAPAAEAPAAEGAGEAAAAEWGKNAEIGKKTILPMKWNG